MKTFYFSDIVSDDRHLKVGKTDGFRLLRKILSMSKMGVNRAFLGPWSILFRFVLLLFSVFLHEFRVQ